MPDSERLDGDANASTKTSLVFGPAAQQPFATLDRDSRQRVGRAAREKFEAR